MNLKDPSKRLISAKVVFRIHKAIKSCAPFPIRMMLLMVMVALAFGACSYSREIGPHGQVRKSTIIGPGKIGFSSQDGFYFR